MQHTQSQSSRRLVATAAGLGALALAITGCGSSNGSTPAVGQSAAAKVGAGNGATVATPATVSISGTLSNGRLVTDQPLQVTASNGTVSGVTVTTGGKAVAGSYRNGTWTPSRTLSLNTEYTVKATAKNSAGTVATGTKSFTTINPSTTAHATGIIPDNGTGGTLSVGNAQAIAVTFATPVKNKAAVLKALKVTESIPVTGAWHWLSDTRVDFRPKTFWPVGEKVDFTGQLSGLQLSPGVWGDRDVTTSFKVTSTLQAVVSEANHTMTVTENGKVIRTMPAGVGMYGYRSWTGAMVVLDKMYSTRMTSCSVGLGCSKNASTYYDMTVYYDVRLTPSGTFVHSAPWDGSIGYANTSHGCVHLRSWDAAWFEQHVIIGNLVTIHGVGAQVATTNGEGDWNLTWAQWTK